MAKEIGANNLSERDGSVKRRKNAKNTESQSLKKIKESSGERRSQDWMRNTKKKDRGELEMNRSNKRKYTEFISAYKSRNI